jgi:5-methylcytosine-specific restriction endonuclease McrA
MSIDMTHAPIPKPEPRKKTQARAKRAEAAIVRLVRAAVVRRAEGLCERCCDWVGNSGHAHHILPRSRGGRWTVLNITYLCQPCHQREHETGCHADD